MFKKLILLLWDPSDSKSQKISRLIICSNLKKNKQSQSFEINCSSHVNFHLKITNYSPTLKIRYVVAQLEGHMNQDLNLERIIFIWSTGLQGGPYKTQQYTQMHTSRHTHRPKNAKAHIGLIKCNRSSLTRKIAQWKSQIEKERGKPEK